MNTPTRMRQPLGTSPAPRLREGRQSSLLGRSPNHNPARGFCNTRCETCEAQMAESIRRNNARARAAR